MKKYWWILMLAISYVVYMAITMIREHYFPTQYSITSLTASFIGIFLVFWFFRGYFPKKKK